MIQGEDRCLLWGAPLGDPSTVSGWTPGNPRRLAGPPGPCEERAWLPPGKPLALLQAAEGPLGGQDLGVFPELAGTPLPTQRVPLTCLLLGASCDFQFRKGFCCLKKAVNDPYRAFLPKAMPPGLRSGPGFYLPGFARAGVQQVAPPGEGH